MQSYGSEDAGSVAMSHTLADAPEERIITEDGGISGYRRLHLLLGNFKRQSSLPA